MAFGVPMVRQRVEREVDESARARAVVPRHDRRHRRRDRAAPVDAGPRPAPKPRRRSGADAAAHQPTRAPRAPGSDAPAGDELPIPGYDALSASQVVERLAGLTPGELDAVHAYEAAHRHRRTILGKIEQLAG